MRSDQLIALLTLDWRRMRRQFTTLAIVLGLVLVYFGVTGKMDLEHALVFGVGLSIGPLAAIGTLGLRDRMEGTLGLLASLPVRPGELAALRLASVALLLLPVGIFDGLWMGATLPVAGLPMAGGLVLGVITWVMLASTAIWLVAVAVAVTPDRASTVFAVMFLTFIASGQVFDRIFPDSPETLVRSILQPAHPWLIPVSLASVLLVSTLGAWALTAWGIRNYTMEAERPS
ncbi:MAG: hypothetical protein ACYC1S_13365 [Gemmatimonadaceae bacterium]